MYEYIVFRGSDVKDLRIEKEPEKKPVQQPQVPDDPAILGVSQDSVQNFSKNDLCKLPWVVDARYLMKYLGCKPLLMTTESAKPCGYLRCLPSDT